MSETGATEPQGGLWAWYEGKFYALQFNEENRHVDHAHWFYEIGLPDYGEPFDRVVRGRMIWDWHLDHYVLTFYEHQTIPNPVYEKVIRTFNQDGHKVVERSITSNWA